MGRGEVHIVPAGGRRQDAATWERKGQRERGGEIEEKRQLRFLLLLCPTRPPSRQRRNEANQLRRNFLPLVFAWKSGTYVLARPPRRD